MDVDAPSRQGLTHPRREDLHVACQDDELDVVLVDDVEHGSLEGVPGLPGHLLPGERDLVELRDRLEVGVIRHDPDDVDRETTGVAIEEQVGQAVRRSRGQDEGTHGATQPIHSELGVESGGHLAQRLLDHGGGFHALHLQTHEEVAGVGTRELLQLGEVAARLNAGPRHRMHDSGSVLAGPSDDQLVGVGSRVEPVGVTVGRFVRGMRCSHVSDDTGPGPVVGEYHLASGGRGVARCGVPSTGEDFILMSR